jgi:hypothetical protein
MQSKTLPFFPALLLMILLSACKYHATNNALYSSPAYSVYPDSVRENNFTAKALSDTEMVSDYKSPALHPHNAEVTFKFSINGDDNENAPGKNHTIVCLSKNCSTPVITFGQPWADSTKLPDNSVLQDSARLTIRVNMQLVLDAFKQKGYFTAYNGKKIYKNEFKGVYVAGDVTPLTWDFANLATHADLKMNQNGNSGIYELTIALHPELDTTASHWKLSSDINNLPEYISSHTLINALYDLSLEEMQQDIRPDKTFMAGAKWDGVWTRDVSYSTLLSLAILRPDICRNSLMKKVNKNGVIIQDTGTGGSYPCSTDRMVWALAAWEVYKVTGDASWLRQSYQIIKNSARDDEQNIFDPQTGLVHGETSFMDWREQSYPRWMQPVDIFNSECLSTNAVHYETNIILAKMSEILSDHLSSERFSQIAAGIKNGINQYLWIPGKGYYGEYLYGKNYRMLSQRPESLGEALSILFGITSPQQRASVLDKMPVLDFGIPCFYPQIPNIPPYHNDAIWPFVDAFWTLAAAKSDNEKAVMEGMNSIYRAAAFFLTNKENMVADNGDYIGTQVNSGRQLWSVAGNLAMIYKVIFGMHFQPDSLRFSPFVPQSYKGRNELKDFHYRNASLDIMLTGYGNKISSFSLDGKKSNTAAIPGNIEGKHTINIVLSDNILAGNIHLVQNHIAPEVPVTALSGDTLHWQSIAGAKNYEVIINGKKISTLTDTQYKASLNKYAEFQVIAVDSSGYGSFACAPIVYIPEGSRQIDEMEQFAPASSLPYKGYSGKGFVEISITKNTKINFHITIPEDGEYAVDFRYANGNGPINTDNKCAMRSFYFNGQRIGTAVFPQRGQGQWSNWGFSNAFVMKLKKGRYPASLILEPANANMNGSVNQAMLDEVRIIRIN